jgi:hypothetical protein
VRGPNVHRGGLERRGAAGMAVVLMLVVLQLVVVCVVLAGARDQDMTVERVNASRAYYAADAGVQMAFREVMAQADYDGDGHIGSVSADGNSANDPSVGGASVAVTENLGALTSAGRAGSARRVLSASSEAGFQRRVIYANWPNNVPQVRRWMISGWGPPTASLDFGAKQYWAAIRRAPVRTEVVSACSLQGDALKAAVQSGSAWGNMVTLTNDVGSTFNRPFSVGYEQSTGRAMVAYRNANSSNLHYRMWDGSAWSSPSNTGTPLSGRAQWIRLVPKPGSAEMAALIIDDNEDIGAMIWDGAAWGNKVVLETGCTSIDAECVDAGYETLSGRLVVVWGKASVTLPQMRVFDGSSWGVTAALPALSGHASWVKLDADSASNKLIAAFSDDGGRVYASAWTGLAWGPVSQVAAAAATTGSRCFDVAFEPAGTRGMVVWGTAGSKTPQYRLFDGLLWGSTQLAPAFPTVPFLIQLGPSSTGTEIMMLANCTGGQNSLEFMRWDGSQFGQYQNLEANVSGPAGREVFMVADQPAGTAPATYYLRGWSETAPQ